MRDHGARDTVAAGGSMSLAGVAGAGFTALVGCTDADTVEPTVRQPSWHGTLGGIDVDVAAELHGWHRAAHANADGTRVEGRDFFAIYERITATNGGQPVPWYDTSASDAWDPTIGTPADAASGAIQLESLGPMFCPMGEGVVYRTVGRPWRTLWPLGDAVYRVELPDVDTSDCASAIAALPPREVALAAHPGGMSTCLALDDAGFPDAAIDCLFAASEADLQPVPPLPAEGPVEARVQAQTTVARDTIVARLSADDGRMDAIVERAAAGRVRPATGGGFPLRLLDAAGRKSDYANRVGAACADPAMTCERTALVLVGDVLRFPEPWNISPESCAAGLDLAAAVRRRKDHDVDLDVLVLVRALTNCDDEGRLAPLMVGGLGRATSEDFELPSPGYRDYPSIDTNCRRSLKRADQVVSPTLCDSFPRLAGTWLSEHCTAEGTAEAKRILAQRPVGPIDPREDQVQDGALRVLGRCDPDAFEAAIAALPDRDETSAANLMSKEKLRAAFASPIARKP